jgi:hypothetical protein
VGKPDGIAGRPLGSAVGIGGRFVGKPLGNADGKLVGIPSGLADDAPGGGVPGVVGCPGPG